MRRLNIQTVVPGVLLLAAACSSPADRPAEPPAAGTALLFEGVRLIDGGGGAPVENAAFLVEHKALLRAGIDGFAHGVRDTEIDDELMALEGNPLEDITNTRRIARVYLRGQEVDRAGLRAMWTGGSTN